MKLKAKLVDTCLTLDGGARITLDTKDRQSVMACIDDFREGDITVEIKKYKPKRSISANSYAWVLMGELASKLRIPREEVYRSYIKEIGGNSETICVRDDASEKLKNAWQDKGLGWLVDELPSKLKGCTNLILYYGSSVYDTEQMSRLINLIVEDCKSQGIQTETPEEIERMIYYGELNNSK